jgi:outer membrane lipoprotein-sorting protein
MSVDDQRPSGRTAGGTILVVLAVILATGPVVGIASSGGGAGGSVADHGHGIDAGNADAGSVGPAQVNGSGAGTDNRTAAGIIQEAARSYENVTGFSATQVTNATYGNDTTNTVAQFYYREPSNLRINYTAPASQAGTSIVSNGSGTVIYNATNNTVRTFQTPNISGQSTGYLATIERTLRTSNVTYEGTETVAGEETYVLSATPAGNVSGDIDRTYYLDQETYIPIEQRVETTFTFDNETVTSESTTTFRGLEVNPGIPEGTFDFEPPAGAVVLESPIDYTQYGSIDAAEGNVSFEIREPAALPEEYDRNGTTVARFGNTTSVYLSYTNGSGGTTLVSITAAQYDGSSMGANDSGSDAGFGESVTIDGREGTYIAFGPQATVTFPCGELQYSISGPLGREELIAIAESTSCEGSEENTDEDAEKGSGDGDEVFAEPIEIEFDGIELTVGPPADPDDDGVSEDVTGDGAVDSVDALAHAAVVGAVEDGQLDLTDEQASALDIDGDGDLDYDDAEALAAGDAAGSEDATGYESADG